MINRLCPGHASNDASTNSSQRAITVISRSGGHQKVFSDRRLPRSTTQLRLEADGRVFYLDRAFAVELLAVELDGTAYHGGRGERERDVRRDAALARLDWLTVRYSHPRLHNDPGGVIEELLEILERRRSQLRVSA